MKFKDCKIKGVRQDANDHLHIKLVVKPEDYIKSEYELLHGIEVEKLTMDVDVNPAQSTNPVTGEITVQENGSNN